MKVAIIFSDGVKQINFTPENDDEKQALKLITPNDDIQLAVKSGTFAEKWHKPFSVELKQCKGGYLRAFDNSESIMLVLTPKENKKEETAKVEPTVRVGMVVRDKLRPLSDIVTGFSLPNDIIHFGRHGQISYGEFFENIKTGKWEIVEQ